MKRQCVCTLAACAILAAYFLYGVSQSTLDAPRAVEHQEDDPEWDWKVDGNRTAGGTVTMFDGETFDVLVTVNEDGSYFITEKE